MSFDSLLQSVAPAFASMFGESVVYTKEDGTERTITAVIYRDPPEPLADVPAKNLAHHLEVEVRNDASEGISASELKTRMDTITVAERLGETAQAFPITRLVSQDAGMLRLRLR